MAEVGSTQQFVEIKDIRDGVIALKSGGLRRILMVSGVNFDLKSEEEQNIILYSFQSLLNALDFSIQIMIHSRKVNIEPYLAKLQERREQEPNELLKIQIDEYAEFVKSFVSENAIMDKHFFLVIPYDPISLPGKKQIFSFFEKNKSPKEQNNQNEDFQKNLQQLDQRTDEIVIGLQKISLQSIPLNTDEVTELFYNLYNPRLVERKMQPAEQENGQPESKTE